MNVGSLMSSGKQKKRMHKISFDTNRPNAYTRTLILSDLDLF